MIDCKVIATGSKGNATVLNKSILIDCGISFKMLDDYYKDLQIVLLTHIHGDHFNKKTIERLSKERPTLRFAAPIWLKESLLDCKVDVDNVDVIKMTYKYDYGQFKIKAFPLIHDVANCGYKIYFVNGKKAIYATDSSSLEGITAKEYDLYLIEANYLHKDIVNRIHDKLTKNQYMYEYRVLKNHMSRENADRWLSNNMGEQSQFIYMHQHESEE